MSKLPMTREDMIPTLLELWKDRHPDYMSKLLPMYLSGADNDSLAETYLTIGRKELAELMACQPSIKGSG